MIIKKGLEFIAINFNKYLIKSKRRSTRNGPQTYSRKIEMRNF